MILQNQVKCLECGDEPFSASRHDFKTCKCGKVSVDGGMAYLRRVYTPGAHYEEMSIEIPDKAAQEAVKAIQWAREKNRNDLGALCAVARVLRDNNVILVDRSL